MGAALALRPGYDWFFPYYRDRALCLALGVTPEEMFLQAVGAATDPASGGRQMPTHWSSHSLHIVSTSSSTTTQVLHAVGCAEAGRYFSRHPEAAAKAEGDYRAFHDVEFHGDEIALTCLGEGSTSQGEFWEALNTASNQKLPVIFCVEDNGYAISVPVEVNTPGGNISKLVANFPNFHFAEIDGTDPEACLRAFQAAAEYCRAGHGPAFVHGHVRAALLPFALRRRQALPLRRRARSRCHARSAGQDADAPAARGHSQRRGDQRPRAGGWTAKQPKPPERALQAPLPEISGITAACLLRRSRPDQPPLLTSKPKRRAQPAEARSAAKRAKNRAPWPTSSMPACTTRCAAIRASSSTAKMWPTPAAKMRWLR